LGVAKLPPMLCRGRTGVTPFIDTRGAFGVVAVLSLSDRTDALSVPARALSSCFAVMPRYLLARDPAVMFVPTPAFVDVLVPSSVLVGLASSSSSIARPRTDVEIVRAARPGVLVIGRGRSDGVIRPERLYDAREDAKDRCDDATDAGRDMPDVGADNLAARTNTPHRGGQVKYGTLL